MVPAVPLGVAGTFMPIILPYIAWNMLNMPTGVAPITRSVFVQKIILRTCTIQQVMNNKVCTIFMRTYLSWKAYKILTF